MNKDYIYRSPIFYMGNKCKLLKQLLPLFPKSCETFVDLFGGSGVVSMNYQGTNKTIYNEFNHNIVELVKMVKEIEPKDLDNYLKNRIHEFDIQPIKDRKYFENEETYQKQLEKQKGYYSFREFYNNTKERDYRDLYLLACFSINHLIRFNKDNQFNASCGNLQQYSESVYEQICNMHNIFQNVIIQHNDALSLNLNQFSNNDFIYCDPPYLNTKAVYNEKRAFGGWDIDCDKQLFNLLEEANKRGIKWGLSNVFENRDKRNEHLIKWCEDNNWYVYHLNRNYNPFSRGNSNNDEVYICNYTNQSISEWLDKLLEVKENEDK